MKQFLLFGFEESLANGGMDDYLGDFDTLDEILIFAKAKYYDDECNRFHILSLISGKTFDITKLVLS